MAVKLLIHIPLSHFFLRRFAGRVRPGPREHEGRGQSAPRKFWGNENARPEPGTLRTCMNLALGIALLLSDERFQKTLRLQIGVPNVSKGGMFAL